LDTAVKELHLLAMVVKNATSQFPRLFRHVPLLQPGQAAYPQVATHLKVSRKINASGYGKYLDMLVKVKRL
jgi:hypothetical protein